MSDNKDAIQDKAGEACPTGACATSLCSPCGISKIALLFIVAAILGTAYLNQNNKQTCESGNQGRTLTLASAAVAAEIGAQVPASAQAAIPAKKSLPRLLDLGSVSCIPCKLMAPILEELKKEYAGRMDVEFIDVNKDREAARKYGIKLIPTQIFFDAEGKERFRHEGFIGKEDILAKWKELGVNLMADAAAGKDAAAKPAGGETASGAAPAFSRLEPAKPDARAKDAICYMCDGDIKPKTRTVMKTDKGDVAFCSPHCYFIAWSSLMDKSGVDEKVSVTDWSGNQLMPALKATYLYGADDKGRPTIKAFADKDVAAKERQTGGGNILTWSALKDKELATRCGFCDRAVYPEDGCRVKVADGMQTWGCCTMCALGVAARLQKDIEVEAKDALDGTALRVKTAAGQVSALEPASAVGWAGSKKTPEGKVVSTGCFHQAFFANEANLKKWVEQRPAETGRMVSINQALQEKMNLSKEQILKACKIGECAPK
ncbi:MAG: organomercurial lyase [Candidatus Sumerlaeota bacterium]|nr:organomercurial lyase [Candidatus Sumerlaeota bacterium]